MSAFRDSVGKGKKPEDQHKEDPSLAESISEPISDDPSDLSVFSGLPSEPPSQAGHVEFAEVEDADYEDEAPHLEAADNGNRIEVTNGDNSKRRLIFAGLAVLVLLLIIIATVSGSKKTAPSTPTTTQTTGSVATPTSTASSTSPSSHGPAAIVTTPVAPTITGPKGAIITTPSIPKGLGSINNPDLQSLGFPNAQETAAAKNALQKGIDALTQYHQLHCVGPNFHYSKKQNLASYLVANPGQLECNILVDTGYHIQVVTGNPKPFLNNQEGQLAATFAGQAGFILLYTSAGKIKYPYIQEIKITAG